MADFLRRYGPIPRQGLAGLLVAALALVAVLEGIYLVHLRSLASSGGQPRSPVATPAASARIQFPLRGNLTERQMSRGVYIAAASPEELEQSEELFFKGLRLFLGFQESQDRRLLKDALAAFEATNRYTLNRYRRYSFFYQAYCQQLLGRTIYRDLYFEKGYLAPSHYDYFFSSDPAGVTRFILRVCCDENVRALRQALELYATRNGGNHPAALADLVPTCLNVIPRCPSSAADTYTGSYHGPGGDAPATVACTWHRAHPERSTPSPAAGCASAAAGHDEELWKHPFFVYWLLLEDYAEQERFDSWATALLRSGDLKPGDVVADIGCGRGLFTFAFAERVAPGGTVLALDTNPGVLDFVDHERQQHPGVSVQTRRSGQDEVDLPRESVDVAFLVEVFHAQAGTGKDTPACAGRQQQLRWLRSIYQALKPGGRLVIEDGRVDAETVREQVCQAGFEFLPDQAVTPKLREHTLTVFRRPR